MPSFSASSFLARISTTHGHAEGGGGGGGGAGGLGGPAPPRGGEGRGSGAGGEGLLASLGQRRRAAAAAGESAGSAFSSFSGPAASGGSGGGGGGGGGVTADDLARARAVLSHHGESAHHPSAAPQPQPQSRGWFSAVTPRRADPGPPGGLVRSASAIRNEYAPKGSRLDQELAEARQRLAERGEKLNKLQDNTDLMEGEAKDFATIAEELHHRYANKKWWQL